MSRRSSGRSVIALILEIGLIVLVVSLLPKLNLGPQSPEGNPAPGGNAAPESAVPPAPWWQAQPAARATSWRSPSGEPVNVEQTLEDASRQLLRGVADHSRTAADVLPPQTAPPLDSQPSMWRRY